MGEIGGQLPDFFIVGAMRSGTTSLARYLGARPDVFVPAEKELHFFDAPPAKQDLELYRRHFIGAAGCLAVGEATQSYMYEEQPAARMAAAVPDARLIAILRNPVDRAYSHYWMSRERGREDLSFVDALAAEPERLATGGKAAGVYHSYVHRGHYMEQLQRLCTHYPRESLLVVLFEDLCDRPVETFQTVCRFLQLDELLVPAEVGRPANRYVGIRSLRLRRLNLRLPARLRPFVGRLNARRSEYTPMGSAVRRDLEGRFQGGNRALAAWLGRDLSPWQG